MPDRATPELDADELRRLQLERLQWSLGHAYANVPHYREAFVAAGVRPDDLRELADLARFPTTIKDDLPRHHTIGVTVAVEVVPPATLERSLGKSKRIDDRRGQR